MNKQLLAVFFLAGIYSINAQEKTTEIDSIEIQGKFISTPYKNANQIFLLLRKQIF
ncbi:hypothetical protein [Chryseobacterium sp. 3008163]|uniref:hypothetical protein n=1 Tax=Chryseobacterium sp. 3008163 TaxID=2478663 RepID=UPI001E5B3A3E|nr:hypothetical protein [Chryseobacterium sp. 3008163]